MHFANKLLSFIVVLSLLLLPLLPSSLYAKESPIHFKIDWPENWNVSPIQKKSKGAADTYLMKASKVEDGKPRAVIVVHELPITDSSTAFLDKMFASSLKTQEKLFLKSGFSMQIAAKESFQFKGFNAKRTTLRISKGEQLISQMMTMILTGKRGYSITAVIMGELDKGLQEEMNTSVASLTLF